MDQIIVCLYFVSDCLRKGACPLIFFLCASATASLIRRQRAAGGGEAQQLLSATGGRRKCKQFLAFASVFSEQSRIFCCAQSFLPSSSTQGRGGGEVLRAATQVRVTQLNLSLGLNQDGEIPAESDSGSPPPQKTTRVLQRDGPEDGRPPPDPPVAGAGAAGAGEAGGQRLGDVCGAGPQGDAAEQQQRT